MKKLWAPVLFSFFLISISCSTEEADVTPVTENPEVPQTPTETNFTEENPLSQFLSTTRYDEHQVLCSNTSTFDEVGFKFKILEKGTINSLWVKIPIINNNLVVKITDAVTNQTIRIESINIAVANIQVTKSIVPIELEKGKTYYITMKTNNYYKRFRSDYTQPTYPVTVGNVKIITPISTTFSPDGVTYGGTGNFYSGDCSFTFLRTE